MVSKSMTLWKWESRQKCEVYLQSDSATAQMVAVRPQLANTSLGHRLREARAGEASAKPKLGRKSVVEIRTANQDGS